MVVSKWWSQWDVERTLKQACSLALQYIVYHSFLGIVRHIQLHPHPYLIYLWAYEIQNVLMYNVRPLISIIISRGIFFFMFIDLGWEVVVYFVDFGVIVDHHYLNFLFIELKTLACR